MCGDAENVSGCPQLESFLAKRTNISADGFHLAMMCLKKLKILDYEGLFPTNTKLDKSLDPKTILKSMGKSNRKSLQKKMVSWCWCKHNNCFEKSIENPVNI